MSDFNALQALLGGSGSSERDDTPDPARVDSFVLPLFGDEADQLLADDHAAEESGVDFASQQLRERFIVKKLGIEDTYRGVSLRRQSVPMAGLLCVEAIVARTPRDSAWAMNNPAIVRHLAEMRLPEDADPRLAEIKDGAIERLAELDGEDSDESPVNAATRRQLLEEA